MSTRQDKSTLDHSFLIEEGLVSREEINAITNHILATVDDSFVQEKKNNKIIHQRVCPLCAARIGHFGTNFKRHMHVCCPLVYDDLQEKTNGEYYSSKKNMEKAGIFDREWVTMDQATFMNLVDKVKNVQPDVSRKKKSEKKERKMSKKEMKRLERLEKLRSKEDAVAQRRVFLAASTPGVRQVLVPPSALWYNNTKKYMEQQVGEAFSVLSSEPDKGKKLLMQQMNQYPFKNDNLRTILQEEHTRDYERNCDLFTAIFETPDSDTQTSGPRVDVNDWKQWIATLDGDIQALHQKIDQASTRQSSQQGAKKRMREGDYATDSQQAPKRARTGMFVSI